ncbi:MAG: ATP synthase subunit I [Deltaproteobacteria bacterium]|nr:ATP synthase subunit I [Deltaproteobacteria bacterium]
MKATSFLKMTIALDGALLGIALVLAFVLSSDGSVYGLLVGGALGAANLFALGWFCLKAISSEGGRWPYLVGMALKFVLLITLVYLAVAFLPMNVIWFVVGLSASGLAILGATAYLSAQGLDLTL